MCFSHMRVTASYWLIGSACIVLRWRHYYVIWLTSSFHPITEHTVQMPSVLPESSKIRNVWWFVCKRNHNSSGLRSCCSKQTTGRQKIVDAILSLLSQNILGPEPSTFAFINNQYIFLMLEFSCVKLRNFVLFIPNRKWDHHSAAGFSTRLWVCTSSFRNLYRQAAETTPLHISLSIPSP